MMRRKAYTMMELAMVSVVVAIVVAAAATSRDNGAKLQGGYAGESFETDVAYARNQSIARPDDPIVIKIDQSTNKYWLARVSAQDTPIAHPQSGQPYVVQFGSSGKTNNRYVQISAFDFGGDSVLMFDGTGNSDQQTDAVLQLTSDGAEYEVIVTAAAAQAKTSTGYSKNLSTGGGGGGGTHVMTAE